MVESARIMTIQPMIHRINSPVPQMVNTEYAYWITSKVVDPGCNTNCESVRDVIRLTTRRQLKTANEMRSDLFTGIASRCVIGHPS